MRTLIPDETARGPSGEKGLKGGVLGLLSGTVIGLASTAPAYSLAATLGLVVLLVGERAPLVMLLAFVPMFLIAIAYRELNRAEPDCGTTFTWAGRAFGPWMGWMGGWGIIAAGVIVMASLAQVAGSYSFRLVGADSLAEHTGATTLAGVVWIVAMTVVCHRGIEISARLQYLLLGIELVVLAVFATIALVKVYGGSAPEGSLMPSVGWLWPGGISLSDLVAAILLAVFIYWGWDTAVAVNEESAQPDHTPGRAAVLSTLLLLATYTLVTVATVAFAGTGTDGIGLRNETNAKDVFNDMGTAVFGQGVLGSAFVTLLIIAVLTSAAASTLTTILPTARATLSMATYRALPRRFAEIHPRFFTPTWSTWGMGIASVVFYVGLTRVSKNVLADSITAVGLLIAFYYGLTGFACVWYYRHQLRGRDLWMKGVLPFLGGLMLLAAFVKSAVDYADPNVGKTTVFGLGGVFIVGIGSLLFGAVLMLGYSRAAPAFFRGETLRPARNNTPKQHIVHQNPTTIHHEIKDRAMLLDVRATAHAITRTDAQPASSAEFELVDLRDPDSYDEELLRTVYEGLYLSSFPVEEERQSPKDWIPALLGEDDSGLVFHAVVAGRELANPRRRLITGFVFFEFYPQSRCGLIAYLAVDPLFRQLGLGRRLVEHALQTLRNDAAEVGRPLKAVFAEIHDPDLIETTHDVMNPAERMSFFAKLNARKVPIRYVQPALRTEVGRARSLQLVVLPVNGGISRLLAIDVRAFLTELYNRAEGGPAKTDHEFLTMTAALSRDLVELEPLNSVEEDPSFTVEQYGIAFEFVTQGAPVPTLDPPSEALASFERDSLAYADRDTAPFSTKAIHVPEPCRRIDIEFCRELRFTSEGRMSTLVSTTRGIRHVEVQVRASVTTFKSGVRVWHLVLTPRPHSNAVALTEFDLIKLVKLWEGGEEVRGSYAGEGPETAVQFRRGDQIWTLRELAQDVFKKQADDKGPRPGSEMPRAGIVQLIVEDEGPIRWRDAWSAIRAAQKEIGVDTSFPLQQPSQRPFIESIAGVIQGLIDFREVDDAELHDIFAAMDVGEDGLRGIHKGTLVYFGASDRPWEVGKLSYGVSPYLLLPHALLLHNEQILRTVADSVGNYAEIARKSSDAKQRLFCLFDHTGCKILHLPHFMKEKISAAFTAAHRSRKARKALRGVRQYLHEALERDYLPNVFHYPNERKIYDAGELSRGLAALAARLRDRLLELNARWETGSSMRRAMAGDLQAALLFVLGGLVLKDWINPIMFVLPIFGLGAVVYIAFRFYSWM